MPRRRRPPGDYHLLVAQNFLSNISLNGTHNDTKLRIFNRPGVENSQFPGEYSCAARPPVPRLPLTNSPPIPENDYIRPYRRIPASVSAPPTQRLPNPRRFTRFTGDSSRTPTGRRSVPLVFPSNKSRHLKNKKFEKERATEYQSLPEFPEYDEAVQSTSVTQVRSEREERRRPPHPTPKRSLLHRFTRIVSSDDFAYGDEEIRGRDGRKAEMIILEDRPSSPLSTSHNLTFLKRLRYTLAKGERFYLCPADSALSPFVTVSYFPLEKLSRQQNQTNQNGFFERSSRRFNSQERLRHVSGCSTEELRPFEFKEGEELTFGHMFDESRERAFTLGSDGSPAICRKERRGSLVVGSLLNVATAAAGLISRSSSCEPGMETSVGELGEAAVRLEYDPSILSEIASVQHSVVRFTSYSCALCSFATEDEQKRSVNEKFRSKFPNIHLTYSKFRSLKLELLNMALECNIDMSTLALAFVYFEKVVLKGLISKSNRKLVVGACFLVAIKVTDIGAVKLKQLISYVEDKLRVDARELLALEIPLCVALHFDLNPPLPQLKPHYDRLVFGTV